MRKNKFYIILVFIAVFFLAWLSFFAKMQTAYAIDDCPNASISPGISTKDNIVTIFSNEIFSGGNPYRIQISKDITSSGTHDYFRSEILTTTKDNQISVIFPAGNPLLIPGTHHLILEYETHGDICKKTVNVNYENDCVWTTADDSNLWVGQNITINLASKNLTYFSNKRVEIKKPDGNVDKINNFNGSLNYTPQRSGVYKITFFFSYMDLHAREVEACFTRMEIGSDSDHPGKGIPTGSPGGPGAPGDVNTKNICANDTSGQCDPCFKDNNTWTALGCIETHDLTETISWFVRSFVFIASGIAFLLMAFGAFQIITASGDPKKAQAGSEVITSALSGLLFILLSIFLLKLIGVDILRIPGFG